MIINFRTNHAMVSNIEISHSYGSNKSGFVMSDKLIHLTGCHSSSGFQIATYIILTPIDTYLIFSYILISFSSNFRLSGAQRKRKSRLNCPDYVVLESSGSRTLGFNSTQNSGQVVIIEYSCTRPCAVQLTCSESYWSSIKDTAKMEIENYLPLRVIIFGDH